jgi:hypothetical protein
MWFRPGVQFGRMSLGLVVTLLCADGCTPAPDRTTHTALDYRSNPALRQAELKFCDEDPGSRAKVPDCVNAREAERIEGVGSLRALPPLELPTPHADSNAKPRSTD